MIAYGYILPKEIIDIPKLGCFNLHGSLLPKYRGAAPIQRSIIAGDKVTGVSFIKVDEGLDTGDVLLDAELIINDEDTCLLYTSPSPRDGLLTRMPSSA